MAAGAAAAGALAAPAVGRAQRGQVLRFIPQADLAVLDPVWTTAYVTRNHGYLVFDTLYGQAGPEGGFAASPQMLAGHAVEDDGRTWRLVLRDGLRFHDGEPVLARDCVASIRRWGARDSFGQTLLGRTNELAAPDDKTIRFRLKRPFPLLPDALGKIGSNMCAIMPERLAATDPFKQVTEMVGSGPFRFKADERVSGSLVVYERFGGYRPREGGGAPEWTAGPKVAHFERVEWQVVPDPATAAAALQSGEVDGWELPTGDLLPVLRSERTLKLELVYEMGSGMLLRPNHLFPPFDNPAVRRALLGVVDQTEAMIAVAGTDPSLRKVPCGFFPPGSPMASDAGMAALAGERDYDRARRDAAGGRLQGRDGRPYGPGRLPDPEGGERRRRRHDEAGRHGGGLSSGRLGHAGAAARRQEASGAGRLECVLHQPLGGRPRYPGHQRAAARQRWAGLARLADQPADRGAAGRVARRPRPRCAEADRGRDPGAGFRGCALPAARALLQPQRLPRRPDRDPARLPDLLERAAAGLTTAGGCWAVVRVGMPARTRPMIPGYHA